VSVTRTPKPRPEPYEVGAFAGSPAVTYETKPKPKEGLFAKLAAAREARRAERPAGTMEQRRSVEAQKRRLKAIEAGQTAEAGLPEAGAPVAASTTAPAPATAASASAAKKRPATFQKIQQAAFPKTEEVGVA